MVAAVGTAYPIHCTAHGKALLARLDDAALEAAGRAAGTPHRQHHHRAQGSAGAAGRGPDPGWALDLEEHAVGICGIGVHIETGQSEQYALSVALPAARYEGQLDACLAALFQCKAEIESLLAG